MKAKVLLSSLVTLSMVVSSYGVTLADSSSGTFSSPADGQSTFSWSYNDGYLTVLKNTGSVWTNVDFTRIASQVTDMSISNSSAGNTTAYTYSYFLDGMSSLKRISVNDNCRYLKIGNYCPNLSSITVNNNNYSYITIGLTERTSSTIPEVSIYGSTVKSVSLDFSDYDGGTTLSVPASYGKGDIIDYDFSDSTMKSLVFGKGTEVIREGGFSDCDNLTYVTIPLGVTKIEYNAFRDCDNLKSITIPASVKSIGMNAFKNSGLKDITYAGTRSQWYGLVKEYEDEGELVGETLHLDGVTVHCSDGIVAIHENKNNDPYRNAYYQNYVGWEKVDGKWYYRDSDGEYLKNIIKSINDNIYFFNEDGSLKYGWWQFLTAWFYSDKSTGAAVKNDWVQDNGYWYYFVNYTMAKDWKHIGNKWYYFDKSSGKMVTGWQEINGNWYLFDNSGAMLTGWQKSGNTWYYLDKSSGAMAKDWKQIDGKWYFFKSNGAMAAGEWCNGYWLNADGSWTYPHKATWRKTNNKWWFGDDSGWYAKSETLTIDDKSYKFDANGYLV